MFAITITTALTAFASIAAAGSANAGEFQSNGRTSVVRYHDLNLANPADQKILQRRIRFAANRVCATSDSATMAACSASALEHIKAPVDQAIASATTSDRYADAQDAQASLSQ